VIGVLAGQKEYSATASRVPGCGERSAFTEPHSGAGFVISDCPLPTLAKSGKTHRRPFLSHGDDFLTLIQSGERPKRYGALLRLAVGRACGRIKLWVLHFCDGDGRRLGYYCTPNCRNVTFRVKSDAGSTQWGVQ